MDYLLEARDGLPAYALGGAVGRHELRVLPFELDQLLHEPVKFEIADLGCIFEVVLSVVVLDLPAQFFNLSGDGPYAHSFLVRTKASIIYQVLSPEFPRTLKLEGHLGASAGRADARRRDEVDVGHRRGAATKPIRALAAAPLRAAARRAAGRRFPLALLLAPHIRPGYCLSLAPCQRAWGPGAKCEV